MIKQIFSVQDVKVSVFYPPVVLHNEAEARRMMSDVVRNPETQIAKHVEDFRLFRLGEFDDNSGAVLPLAQPEFIANASEFLVSNASK